MINKCIYCGDTIPEGRQICPSCSKERYGHNTEGYPDPTATKAIAPIIKTDAQLDNKVNFLIKVIKFIADNAGFEILGHIKLRHKESGKVYR